ncbi:MBL fold metallo-hydrolase [Leifsonia poae]|uniref:MBL fold metallo-hydrolase n=1 Tax=Leifsonia poae TaxID=110933 RepID=UPI003D667C3F
MPIDPVPSETVPAERVRVRLIGGPTALIELGGLRILTDPTFDPPGDHPSGPRVLVKTVGPAVTPEELGPVDVVLLSHDQHPDNLDVAGREFLPSVPLVVTTTLAADRLGGTTTGLEPWHHLDIDRPDGLRMRISAVPAQHGPDGADASSGPVIGFVLSGDDIPTVYVSGDNVSLRVVEEVELNAGPIDIALLFAGAARTARLDAYLTLTSRLAARAAAILDARAIIPVHTEGWAHFTQGPETLAGAFAAEGVSDRLVLLAPGASVTL